VLRVLLVGINDPRSALARLAGHTELVALIYGHVQLWWSAQLDDDGVFVARIGQVQFPKPTGQRVNMMPIVLPSVHGGEDECKRSLPKALHPYLPLIRACPLQHSRQGQIGYLTVDERTMTADGETHRRAGLHTESPGALTLAPGQAAPHIKGEGKFAPPPHPTALTFFWGAGHVLDLPGGSDDDHCLRGRGRGVFRGGIYMASTVTGSCRVWNARVRDLARPGVVGPLGDVEHLRHRLGEGSTLRAGELAWMTDATPHESLPLAAGTRRQYFRLVGPRVSAWYAAHSTPNPLGVRPPDSVLIINGSKFDAESPGASAPAASKAALKPEPLSLLGALKALVICGSKDMEAQAAPGGQCP
jgi:hypothetical protein